MPSSSIGIPLLRVLPFSKRVLLFQLPSFPHSLLDFSHVSSLQFLSFPFSYSFTLSLQLSLPSELPSVLESLLSNEAMLNARCIAAHRAATAGSAGVVDHVFALLDDVILRRVPELHEQAVREDGPDAELSPLLLARRGRIEAGVGRSESTRIAVMGADAGAAAGAGDQYGDVRCRLESRLTAASNGAIAARSTAEGTDTHSCKGPLEGQEGPVEELERKLRKRVERIERSTDKPK